MNEWKTVRLGDVCIFNPRESIKKGTVAKKIAMDCIAPYSREISSFEYVEFSGGTKFRNGDTIMARITPCLENGKTAFVSILDKDEVAFGSTEYIVFRERTGVIDKTYLYYFVINPAFREIAVKSMVGSSGRQRVQQDVLENLIIDFPSFMEQRRIAGILGALDDKIELNNRINRNLEEQAMALFSRWFVDFEFPDENGNPYRSAGGTFTDSPLGPIPNGWRAHTLDELIYFDPREKTKKGEEYLFFDMKSLSNYTMDVANGIYRLVTSSSSFRNFDTLMAKITPCLENGKTGFMMGLQKNQVAKGSTEFVVMRGRTDTSPYWIYCLARNDVFRSFAIKSMTGSSGRQRVQYSKLKEYSIAYNREIMMKVDVVLSAMFDQIFKLNNENKTLLTLRDTLLPKLMNGEVEV